jgi:hypothetical protein
MKFDSLHYFSFLTAALGFLNAACARLYDVVILSGIVLLILIVVRLLRR